MKKYNSYEDLPDNVKSSWATANYLPFESTHTWFKTLDHTIFNNKEHTTYLISSNDKNSILIPFLLKTKKVLGLSYSEARSLSNFYTSLFQIISLKKESINQEEITNYFNALVAQSTFDIICIEPIANTKTSEYLISALKANDYFVFPYFRFGNWFLDVKDKTFDDYNKVLPSQTRNTVIRKEKKITKDPSYELKIYTREEDVQKKISDYEEIYNLSWKKSEPHPEFIRKIAVSAAQKGQVRLGIAYLNGKPIAAQLWFVKNKYASIFKLAYDPKYKNLSAGSILTYRLMEHVIDIDKVDIIDYLIGDDPYKKSWMSHRRERIGILACSKRSLPGIALAIRHAIGNLIKKIRGPLKF